MNSKISTFCLLALLLPFGACTAVWDRPNTTEAEFNRDRFECQQQALSMYPVIISSPPVYQTPAQTTCTTIGNVTSCKTITPSPALQIPQTDQNAVNRTVEFTSCLEAKGYKR